MSFPVVKIIYNFSIFGTLDRVIFHLGNFFAMNFFPWIFFYSKFHSILVSININMMWNDEWIIVNFSEINSVLILMGKQQSIWLETGNSATTNFINILLAINNFIIPWRLVSSEIQTQKNLWKYHCH